MYVTIVYVRVKEQNINEFIDACHQNHAASIHEDGNCRFDILQSPSEPTSFVLYEAYISEKDAKAHKETSHYIAWRDKVAPWMAEPRQGVTYRGLFPQVIC